MPFWKVSFLFVYILCFQPWGSSPSTDGAWVLFISSREKKGCSCRAHNLSSSWRSLPIERLCSITWVNFSKLISSWLGKNTSSDHVQVLDSLWDQSKSNLDPTQVVALAYACVIVVWFNPSLTINFFLFLLTTFFLLVDGVTNFLVGGGGRFEEVDWLEFMFNFCNEWQWILVHADRKDICWLSKYVSLKYPQKRTRPWHQTYCLSQIFKIGKYWDTKIN